MLKRSRWSAAAIFLSVLAIIGAVYWPVRRAEFIWDDIILFHDAASLRQDDSWLTFLVHGLNGYYNYFRPLVAAFFSLQLRLFDVRPGGMHLVSLALHLANTALVCVVARRFAPTARPLLIAICALMYGLHPALVESVVWISCQNELIVTFLVLIALWANASIASRAWRAVVVSIIFFLAACAKESAIALPLLIAIFDISNRARVSGKPWSITLRNTLRAQLGVYAALFLAGILYIALRTWALGFIVASNSPTSFFSLGHFQKVCFTFMHYVQLAVWPMSDLSPLHEVVDSYFASFSWELLFQDFATAGLLVAGAVLFLKRQTLGALVLSFAAGLFAVLNIIPVPFVESVYHERYLTMPLAVCAAWLVPVMIDVLPQRRVYGLAMGVTALIWLAAAALNVRVTVPLWSDERSLWEWAARLTPNSLTVRQHLLSLYIMREDYSKARALARQLVDEAPGCQNCMLNVAFLALHDGNEPLAAIALERLKSTPSLARNKPVFQQYVLATGELRELRHDKTGAEEAYRDALTLDPDDPEATMELAALLIVEGRIEEGERLGRRAIELFAPDEKQRRQHVLDAILHDATRTQRAQDHPQ